MKYVRTYNESIKHLLKPKISIDEVKQKIDNLEDYKRYPYIIKYDIKKLYSINELDRYMKLYNDKVELIKNELSDFLYNHDIVDVHETRVIMADYHQYIIHELIQKDTFDEVFDKMLNIIIKNIEY